MSFGRRLVSWAIPVAVAATALFNAQTIASLVGATLTPNVLLLSIPVANAATAAPNERPSADAVLDRNPFDHATSLRVVDGPVPDPWAAPACEGVRPLVLVAGDDPRNAFVALDVGGKRVVRRAGGEIGARRVAFIGRESVWLESGGVVCEARLFRSAETSGETHAERLAAPSSADPLGSKLAGKIERLSATEYRVDRGAVEILLDAQTELMKLRLVPEKEGVRVLGVKPGSALALLGIENGDRLETASGMDVTSPEKLLEIYARLKTGALDRLTIRLTRAGKSMNVDYVVR